MRIEWWKREETCYKRNVFVEKVRPTTAGMHQLLDLSTIFSGIFLGCIDWYVQCGRVRATQPKDSVKETRAVLYHFIHVRITLDKDDGEVSTT